MSIAIPLPLYEGTKNTHPAKMIAEQICAEAKDHGTLALIKDCGAGASTGIAATFMEMGDMPLIVEPYRGVVREVLKTAFRCSNLVTAWQKKMEENSFNLVYEPIFDYPTNRDCEFNRDLIKDCPELKAWNRFTVDCDTCKKAGEYEDCYLRNSVRRWPGKGGFDFWYPGGSVGLTLNTLDIVGCGMTYHSLGMSMLAYEAEKYIERKEGSEPSIGAQRIERIFERHQTIILDEIHLQEYKSSVSIPVYDVGAEVSYSYAGIFNGIMKTDKHSYVYLKKMLNNIDKFINNPTTQDAILRCKNEADNKENDKRILNIKIPIPKEMYTGGMDIYNALTKQMIRLHLDGGRPVEKLSDVRNILLPISTLLANEFIELQLEWSNGSHYVNMVGDDSIMRDAIDRFIKECIRRKKTVIFVTATRGQLNFDKYLEKGGHVRTVLMGGNGDPTDAAGDLLILADTYKIGGNGKRNSFNARIPEIHDRLIDILKQTGKQRVVVVCRNAREAKAVRKMIKEDLGWEHNTEKSVAVNDVIVTYYRGEDSHAGRFRFYESDGEYPKSHPADVMVLIGGADTPAHCMDKYSKTAKESKIRRLTEIYIQMFQMMGRIKGSGRRTLVYCIGVNTETIRNCTTWGLKYEMTIDDNPTHPRITLDVGKEINKPSIIGCMTSGEMLQRGRLYLNRFLGVIKYADIGETSFLSESWDSIMKKQIRDRKGFLGVFTLPRFRQLPKLPASVRSISLLQDKIDEGNLPDSLIYILKGIGENKNDKNLIILETDDGYQIIQVGKIGLRTPADINNFSGSLLCGSIDIVQQLLEHYREPVWKEAKRTEAEEHLIDLLKSVRIAKNQVHVTSGLTLLREVWGGCNSRYEVRKQRSDGTWGYFNARDRQGNDKPLNDVVLLDHLAGNHTVLSYVIDDNDKAKHIVFDVDAHEKVGVDTHEDYKHKLEVAKSKRAVIMGLLQNMGMDPILVKSGSLGSYHIVLTVLPVSADKAHYFANCVMEAAGYPNAREHERFPKQPTCRTFYGRDEVPYDELEAAFITRSGRKDLLGPTVDETPIENYMGYGNGTKMPMGLDKKSGQWSYLYHPEEKRWVRYYVKSDGRGFDPVMYWVDERGQPIEKQYFPVRAIDIRGIEIPVEAKPEAGRVSTTEPSTEPKIMRPFFKWLLRQGDLIHTSGHYLRVALFYELAYQCKMTDQQILEVFRGMGLSDFSEAKTMANIRSTRAVGHSRPYSMAKVRALISEANWENYQAGRSYVPDQYKPE